MRAPVALVAAVIALASASIGAGTQNAFLGRWNITGTGDQSHFVYWLEVTDAGGTLGGSFLNRGGNPEPFASVRIEGNELIFEHQRRPQDPPMDVRARVDGDRLGGQHTVPAPGRRGGEAGPGTPVNWIGVRPPTWPEVNANGQHTFGTPVALFDGSSLDAFGVQVAGRPMGWSIEDNVMTNGDGGNNLVSHQTFTNFKVEAEYRLGENSNSGIYLRGRYELQVLDDYGRTEGRADLGHMAIYGRTAPRVNASKPIGEWQAMEAVLVGNRVTVTLNGQRVHDNAIIGGITGGALDANETAPGPIMVQGDHSGVWIRRLVVTPITATR
jgi:hypothetical protein